MKFKVLVADDERLIADTLAIILNERGFEATAVYTGDEAVQIAKTLQPDVLISDVVMPGLHGINVAIEVRKILPTCKILLCSGQNVTADLLEEARSQGHDFEILVKPTPPSALLARLEELINRSEEVVNIAELVGLQPKREGMRQKQHASPSERRHPAAPLNPFRILLSTSGMANPPSEKPASRTSDLCVQ